MRQVLPESLKTINSYAFSGCYNLKALYIFENLNSIGNNAFDGCKKLCFYCPSNCWATEYALQNNIDFVLTNDDLNNEDSIIDFEKTSYYLDYLGLSASGNYDFTFEYSIKEEVQSHISDLSISIYYPQNTKLVKNSLKLDGVTIENYTDSDYVLAFSIPVTGGRIKYSVKPDENINIKSYVSISYRFDGETKHELIGIVNETIPVLTIVIPESTGSISFDAVGIAAPNEAVYFSIGDTVIGNTSARQSGKYNARLTIPNAQEYKTYKITAHSKNKDNIELTASAEIQYAPAFPKMTGFVMTYNGLDYDLTNTDVSPVMLFTNDKMKFSVDFSNPESVSKVLIISERNNIKKYIEAYWNEEENCFTAEGYFDSNNKSYVPGTISVQYQKKGKSMSFTEPIDYANDPSFVNTVDDIFVQAIQSPSQYLTYSETEEDGTLHQSGTLKLPTIDDKLEELGYNFDFFTNKIPSWLNPANATENGYQVVENDAGEQLYMRIAEDVDGKVQGEIIDFIHEKATEFCFEQGWYTLEGFVEYPFALSEACSTVNKLIKWDNNRVKINVLEESILNSNMSDSEKQAALRKVDSAKKLNNSAIAILGLTVVLAAAGITFGFPVSLILPALAWKNSHELDSILSQFGMADASESGGIEMKFRWRIDPSGVIYDAETNNPIEKATVSTYWIPYDDTNDFFDRIPSENEYGILWDSLEYEQLNPLLSDNKGRYAWDVPEGWWRVKAEKEGYETAWSEWVPVPPIQTDVDIYLKPIPGGYVVDYGEVLDEDIPEDGVIPESLWYSSSASTDEVYTGKAIKKSFRVYDYKTLLKEGTDYTVAYSNNIKASTETSKATITITGKGNYKSKDLVRFNILPKSLEDGDLVIAGLDPVKYNGKVQKLKPTFKYNGKTLKSGTDYTLEYNDSPGDREAYKDVGTYSITVKGKGNYSGVRTLEYTILPAVQTLISKVALTKPKDVMYTGEPISEETFDVVLKDKNNKDREGGVLIKGTDYELALSENTVNVGKVDVTITGLGYYSGTRTTSFKITGIALSKTKVNNLVSTLTYDGSEKTQDSIVLTYQKDKNTAAVTLEEGKDYDVSYSNNVNKGIATILFTGKGLYTGTVKKTYKITPYDILTDADHKVSMDYPDTVVYSKAGAKPEVSVYYGDTKLLEGTDYTVSYKNNTAVNDRSNPKKIPSFTIKGKGNFKGSLINNEFSITQRSLTDNVSMTAVDKVYSLKKNGWKSAPVLTDNGKKLVSGTDYDKNSIVYTYVSETVINNGADTRQEGDIVEPTDIIPAGTRIRVTVTGIKNYKDDLSSIYRITKADISKASITVQSKEYTGKPVTLTKDDITVKLNKQVVDPSNYEIDETTYKNNINKGKASVIIRGVNDLGSSKTVNYSIGAKLFQWWFNLWQ